MGSLMKIILVIMCTLFGLQSSNVGMTSHPGYQQWKEHFEAKADLNWVAKCVRGSPTDSVAMINQTPLL